MGKTAYYVSINGKRIDHTGHYGISVTGRTKKGVIRALERAKKIGYFKEPGENDVVIVEEKGSPTTVVKLKEFLK